MIDRTGYISVGITILAFGGAVASILMTKVYPKAQKRDDAYRRNIDQLRAAEDAKWKKRSEEIERKILIIQRNNFCKMNGILVTL